MRPSPLRAARGLRDRSRTLLRCQMRKKDGKTHRCWSVVGSVRTRAGVQIAIFPQDRQAAELDCEVVQVGVDRLQLERPRQRGACWLAPELWSSLQLNKFWAG